MTKSNSVIATGSRSDSSGGSTLTTKKPIQRWPSNRRSSNFLTKRIGKAATELKEKSPEEDKKGKRKKRQKGSFLTTQKIRKHRYGMKSRRKQKRDEAGDEKKSAKRITNLIKGTIEFTPLTIYRTVKHQNQKHQVEMCSLTLIFFNEN